MWGGGQHWTEDPVADFLRSNVRVALGERIALGFAKCSQTMALTPCSARCFLMISHSRSVSLPKRFSRVKSIRAVAC